MRSNICRDRISKISYD